MREEMFSPSPDAHVLVIGGAGVDIVGHLETELLPGSSNPCHIYSSFGGVARNVAENLARLGQAVSFITALGEDEVGDQLLEELNESGVDTRAVVRTREYATGSYLAVINTSGELQFALDDMRATSVLTPAYLRKQADLFKQASLLFLDANIPHNTLRTVVSMARKAHIPICADPTSTTLAEGLIPYLDQLYLITPNSVEASILCDPPLEVENRRQAMNAAKCLVGGGVEIAIITMAELGLCYATSETNGHIPAIRTEIVDPTGAGDALSATVIFALLNDIPIDDAVRLAVSAASLTLRIKGTVVPDLSVEKLYDQLVI